ncbi:MAG: type II toxin-antitoxin system VapC family toxin [Opitutales bacterium]
MILPDLNLLVYAHNAAAPHHPASWRWWTDCMNSETPVALPWIVNVGFIRLTTHPRVLEKPLSAEQAIAYVESWLERPNVLVIEPGKAFQNHFFRFLNQLGTAGSLTTDAYLAALAIEHQAELQSNDADFHRFEGLRWTNPLAG